MINRANNQSKIPTFIPKYSDPDVLRTIINSDFWKFLFLKDKKAIWIIIKALFFLKVEMFIAPLKAVLRYDHGKRTTGIFLTLMSLLMMMAFNTQYIIGYLATFFPLASPIVPFFISGEDLYLGLFVDIKSRFLLFGWIGFLVLSSIHLLRIRMGWGQTGMPNKRGYSWMHGLVFKHMKMTEAQTQLYAEPLISFLIGYGFIATGADMTFGIFLMIAACCLFFQELYDAVYRFSVAQ